MTLSPAAEEHSIPERFPLNPAQRAAVEHLEGPILVVAGAGTGKTRVITERVRHLLTILPDLQGENILAVTFTEKAAGEMKARIVRATGKRGEGVWVGTFHALCHHLLELHTEPFQVLEDVDYWIFLRRRLAQLGMDYFKKLSEPGAFLNAFREFFSRCQDELVTPEDYAGYVRQLAAEFEEQKSSWNEQTRAAHADELRRQEELARVYAASERLLRSHAYCTFGGLLLRGVELLQTNLLVRTHYQERFRYILVDEFQDTNIAQIELVALLAGQRQNVMAVGDDDQAIYRFRGASYGSFRKFSEKFPGHRTVVLTDTYRSTGRILAGATQLIRQNGRDRYQPDKPLRTTRPAGEQVKLVETVDVQQEAEYVAQEIQRLHATAQLSYRAFAVLYRAHHHRNYLVRALVRAGIPFVIRNLSILYNTLVRDLIAYLRVLAGPGDSISLVRLLAMPYWQLQPAHLAELAARAQQQRVPLEEVLRALHPTLLHEHTRLGELLALIDTLREQSQKVTASALFNALLERLKLRLLAADPDRVCLERLASFLREWEERKSASQRLPEFVEYLAFFTEAGGEICLPEETYASDAVQLMTVHAAKGLEFDNVFALRLNRGAFPTARRQPLFVFPERLMKEVLPQGDFHIEEERRLCYVAMTRARDRLHLLTVGGRSKPSVFLEDILRDARVARELNTLAPEPSPVATEAAPLPSEALLTASRATSRCYSQIAAWAAQPAPAAALNPLELSHTRIETYLKCPLKYKFNYVWKIPTRAQPALVFGEIMHSTLAEYFRQRQRLPELPFAELEHLYEQAWRQTRYRFPDPYQEQEYRKAGREQLAAFYARHRGVTVDVLHLEKKFCLPLDDLEITGRIDQINRFGGRTVEIIEYKTGRLRSTREADQSLQLTLYSIAAERVLRLRPVQLVLYDLTSNQPFTTTRNEKQQESALAQVASVAAQIRAGEFPARPGMHCRYCDYHALCPVYEQSVTVLGTAATQENSSPAESKKN